MTVALSSGAGIRSRTPTNISPWLNKLANSTDRCWISSSGLVEKPFNTAAILSLWALVVRGRLDSLVKDVSTNCRVR